MGNALRRGRSRDACSQRLDLDLVGSRRMVLVQARTRFRIQALAMATFGVRYQSNQMLSVVQEGRLPWPEWAVRFPIFLMALLAVYLLYKAIAAAYGRRAAFLGGIVLMTMPQWFLFTHQTMTDMPFVAPMAAAMALLLLGAHSDPEDEVNVYEVEVGGVAVRVSAYHVVIGAVVACALPQIFYLVSRNLTLDIRGLHTHLDVFASGSPGNCDLPGNEACRPASPVLRGLQPALQAAIWTQALALMLYLNWGERRRQRLLFLAAWLFAALSTMAKGPAGLLLPVVSVLAYIAVSRRWQDLLRLEILSGLLVILAVALPWFVAMYARHGQPFTDRLIFHDMFKRAFTHVHDTNDGDDVSFRYYVWQLGYATFPWIGLLPPALALCLRGREDSDRRSDTAVFLAMWFLFAFGLFSLMLTKFHHYILPAIPPAAMLTGILLDQMLAGSGTPELRKKSPRVDARVGAAAYLGGVSVATLVGLYGAYRVISLLRGSQAASMISVAMAGGIFALGVASFVATVAYFGRLAPRFGELDASNADAVEQSSYAAYEQAGGLGRYLGRVGPTEIGAAAVAGAFLVLAVGRDFSVSYDGWFSQIRLVHLITYNYRRPWPTSLDFTNTLWAFTAIGTLLMIAIAIVRVRSHVVMAFILTCAAFGAWGIDVYFQETAPHWGQRETTIAYLNAARELPGPLIAYQMNWKGENFYTGNHVPAFVSSGKKFQDYLADKRRREIEPSTSLRSIAGPAPSRTSLALRRASSGFRRQR